MDNFWLIFIFPFKKGGQSLSDSQMGCVRKWPLLDHIKASSRPVPQSCFSFQQLVWVVEVKNIKKSDSVSPACSPSSDSVVLQGLKGGIFKVLSTKFAILCRFFFWEPAQLHLRHLQTFSVYKISQAWVQTIQLQRDEGEIFCLVGFFLLFC